MFPPKVRYGIIVFPFTLNAQSMTAVLAIDTSTDACSVACFQDGLVRSRHEMIPRAHNQHVLAMVDDVLGTLSLSELDAVVCGVGPGSFTGIRIAVSVVQGLAWATDLPVIALCSLEEQALSYAIDSGMTEGCILSVTDAQIGQLYWRWFRFEDGALYALTDSTLSDAEGVAVVAGCSTFSVVGSASAFRSTLEAQSSFAGNLAWDLQCRPHAGVVAASVANRLNNFPRVTAAALAPQYVQHDIGWKKLSEQPNVL